jgi:hypothetical protein
MAVPGPSYRMCTAARQGNGCRIAPVQDCTRSADRAKKAKQRLLRPLRPLPVGLQQQADTLQQQGSSRTMAAASGSSSRTTLVVAAVAVLAARSVYGQGSSPPCAAEASELVAKVVAKGYSYCTLEEDLGLRLAWIDDGVGYMEAFYGSSSFARSSDNTMLLVLIQRLLFLVVSIGGNARVLFYHWTVPAHPKFSVALGSRWGAGMFEVCEGSL